MPKLLSQLCVLLYYGQIGTEYLKITFFKEGIFMPDHHHAVADPGFPRGGAPTPEGGTNLLFGQFFPKTA